MMMTTDISGSTHDDDTDEEQDEVCPEVNEIQDNFLSSGGTLFQLALRGHHRYGNGRQGQETQILCSLQR